MERKEEARWEEEGERDIIEREESGDGREFGSLA